MKGICDGVTKMPSIEGYYGVIRNCNKKENETGSYVFPFFIRHEKFYKEIEKKDNTNPELIMDESCF